MRLIVPLDVASSTTGFPRLVPLFGANAAGISSSEVEVFLCCASLRGRLFFQARFHHRNSLLTPSVTPQRMSDCVLFPASTSRIRVGSSWAGKESYLSLVDGTCTHIRPRVQPFPIVGLGWLAYVRTDYRDSANNESHSPTPLVFKTVLNGFPLHGSSMIRHIVMCTSQLNHLRLFFHRGSVCVISEDFCTRLFLPNFWG